MLIRTHIALTMLFILLFIPFVEHKIVFFIVALLATFLADVDSRFSSLGKYKVFRFLQFFVKHRTLFHSFTFLALLTLFFVLFFPILAFPFFLGYSSHLVADSFTKSGIRPFWPSKRVSRGIVITGGRLETMIFGLLVLMDLFLFVSYFFDIL